MKLDHGERLPSQEQRRGSLREQKRGRAADSASLLALAARGCPAVLAFAAASHNSLRSLRSLCSITCDESEHEAREYARGHETSASRRRKGALPATHPRLCRGTALLVAGTSLCDALMPHHIERKPAAATRLEQSATKCARFMRRRSRTARWSH